MLEVKELNKKVSEVERLKQEVRFYRLRYGQRIEEVFGAGVLKKIEEMQEELDSLREQVKQYEAQVKYWKWEAMRWGSPEFENFETKQ